MIKETKKLNLGCSGRKKEGYVNIDWLSLIKPDIEHDLNKYPYPFRDSEFDLVEAAHIIEHLDRPFMVMKEIHRITKPFGKIIVRVPHFSRAMGHPEHFHGFDITFPNYFNEEFIDSGYFGVDFEIEKLKMNWFAFSHIAKNTGLDPISIFSLKMANNIINFFANLSPGFCSKVWCFWVGGFDEIEFVFICKK